MYGITCSVEGAAHDVRSNQVAFKLQVSNESRHPIVIKNVVPRLPEGARIINIRDMSSTLNASRRLEILSDLTALINQYLWVSSKEFRRRWVEGQRDIRKDYVGSSGSSKALKVLFRSRKDAPKVRRELRGFYYQIFDSKDAEKAFDLWLAEKPLNNKFKDMFQAKLEQLKKYETQATYVDESKYGGSKEKLGEDEEEDQGIPRSSDKLPSHDENYVPLVRVEPGSHYAAAYVIKFPRHIMECRQYPVYIEVVYGIGEGGEKLPKTNNLVSGCDTFTVTPSPMMLSVIASLAGLLGTIVNLVLDPGSLNADPAASKFCVRPFFDGEPFLRGVCNIVTSGKIIVGPALAFVFFNVYEHSRLARNIDLHINWRSALFLGFVAGLFYLNILSSLGGLVGTFEFEAQGSIVEDSGTGGDPVAPPVRQ